METVEGKTPQHPFAELKSIRLELLTTKDVFSPIKWEILSGGKVSSLIVSLVYQMLIVNVNPVERSSGRIMKGILGILSYLLPYITTNYVPGIFCILNRTIKENKRRIDCPNTGLSWDIYGDYVFQKPF